MNLKNMIMINDIIINMKFIKRIEFKYCCPGRPAGYSVTFFYENNLKDEDDENVMVFYIDHAIDEEFVDNSKYGLNYDPYIITQDQFDELETMFKNKITSI